MKRISPGLWLLVSFLLLAGCGGDAAAPPTTLQTSSTPTQASTSVPPTSASATSTTLPAPRTRAVVYFLHDERLTPVARSVPDGDVATGSLQELLRGPSPAEIARGVQSAIPSGTALRRVVVAAGRATVDVSRDFERGGGSYSMRARVAQVAFTLHRAVGVSSVDILLDGVAVGRIGGEGAQASDVRPSSFDDLLPPVIVEAPLTGEVVGREFYFVGLANVFEGTVNYEVLDAAGRTLAAGFATGAMGSWEQFRTRVVLDGATSGQATILAFTISPEDGRRRDVTPISLRIDIAAAVPPAPCSAARQPAAIADQPGLPAAVAKMRNDLAAAASRCDYEMLRTLIDRNGAGLSYTFGSTSISPIALWRAAEEGGHSVPPMFALRAVLEAPYATIENAGTVFYAWPDIHATSRPTDAQLRAFAELGLYPLELLERWMKAGAGYLGYRVLITASGDWTVFVQGD